MYTNDDIDFEVLLKNSKLSEKQRKFWINLTDPLSKTCGDIVSSYHAVPYKENSTSKYAAYRLYNSEKIQTLLTYLNKRKAQKAINRCETEREKILREIHEIYEDCWTYDNLTGIKKCTDKTSALKCLELSGKAIALFVEKQVVDVVHQVELSDALRKEAQLIAQARLMLSDGREDSPQPAAISSDNAIDTEFIPIGDEDDSAIENDSAAVPGGDDSIEQDSDQDDATSDNQWLDD